MKLLYYLYTFYVWFIGGIYFIAIMLFSIFAMNFISAQKFRPVFTFLLRTFLKIIFIRVKIETAQDFDKSKKYVYMPNHVSLLDAPITVSFFPQFINAIEAKEHFDWPLYGTLIKKWGNIPINRKSIQESIKSSHIAQKKLKDGNSLIIFPEGGRTKNGQLLKFKKLPFHIAKSANVAIIPVGLSGVFSLNPKGTMLLKPGKIKIKLGELINEDEVQSLSINELMSITKNKVESLIEFY